MISYSSLSTPELRECLLYFRLLDLEKDAMTERSLNVSENDIALLGHTDGFMIAYTALTYNLAQGKPAFPLSAIRKLNLLPAWQWLGECFVTNNY